MLVELRIPLDDARALALVERRLVSSAFPHTIARHASGLWFDIDVPATEPSLRAMLATLQALNVHILERARSLNVRLPQLYDSGVRYKREPAMREWWQTILDNLREREGDCEDLASQRAAELEFHHREPARADVVRTGPRTFHSIVRRASGHYEDPSAALGMLDGGHHDEVGRSRTRRVHRAEPRRRRVPRYAAHQPG